MLRLLFRRILPGILFVAVFAAGARAEDPAVTPSTALESYLHNGDLTYGWEVRETVRDGNATVYHLLLTSQKWQDITWTHQLSVIVPDRITHPGALLMITGGSVKDGQPNWNGGIQEGLLAPMGKIAQDNRAVTAVLRQVPNQPLYDSLKEDALISYTLHRFQQDGDYTWPLLFPMTKSAVRAMDAVTEFCAERLQRKVEGFVVAGASKRGWTTCLAAAQDSRVAAAAPMVIDILNMPKSIRYQLEAYGAYSEQIKDYSDLGILQSISSEKGRAIVEMIDPYSYRRKLSQPKLLLMGTNDEFWVADNVKNYIDSIPGINRLHYIPNAGHNLGGGAEAMQTLDAFFASLLSDNLFPTCAWQAKTGGKNLKIALEMSRENLVGAELWSAVSPTRDFRKAEWNSAPLPEPESEKYTVDVPLPETGFKACYVDLIYRTDDGRQYKISTRIFMTDPGKLL